MLTIKSEVTWARIAAALIYMISIHSAVMYPLDSPNDGARWPIPEALFIWVLKFANSRGCSYFV